MSKLENEISVDALTGTEPAHTGGDIGPRSRLRAVWEPCGARCIIVGPLLEDLHP